jgi:hypothetical protein
MMDSLVGFFPLVINPEIRSSNFAEITASLPRHLLISLFMDLT